MHEEAVRHSMALPERAMPLFVIEVLGYLDEQGQQQTRFRTGGNVPLNQLIGTLETVQQVFVYQALNPPQEA